jgi:hypothetical protein
MKTNTNPVVETSSGVDRRVGARGTLVSIMITTQAKIVTEPRDNFDPQGTIGAVGYAASNCP